MPEAAQTELTCQHSEICGGCTYRGVPYEEQLRIKDEEIRSALSEKALAAGTILPIKGAPSISSYRNKMEYTFGDEVKGGPMTLGMHKKMSYMSVVNVPDCKIVHGDFEKVRSSVLEYFLVSGHSHYHKKTHRGLLRNLVLRRGERTNQLLVNLVTTDHEEFDKQAFADMVRSLPLDSALAGILHTVNNKRADAIFREELAPLFGQGYYTERMMDLDFKVEPFAFFQTNTAAFEGMLRDAVALLPEIRGTLFDVYCGTGAIALSLSHSADRVYGLELSEEAVSSAKENARLGGIDNCEFICGDALESMELLAEKGIAPDCLVVDPPRMGIHPKAVKKILGFGLPSLLYISCNPKSFAENMAMFADAGYRLQTLRGYDNFPFTRHIELTAFIVKA
ncbi:MAG: 23S rRNA (uracil(1939)-C(5))-methyltransferase RlmD [Clostridiales Family XIII bacterium]|jgi:23S rRNA (uracil-5-)-methyltransferase RumA|nr:23S rRNA (uracil(1939)-C(5))-methyltransferase RlmD [Clostridiales Family XIII bacterium]